MSSDNPIGKVTHYFCWREYQGRGLQHFHFAIWIEGAPILGNEENETDDEERARHTRHTKKVIKFITRYVSCQIPDKLLSPILHDRVIKYQQHRCNNSKTGIRKICCFGFPRPQCDSFCLCTIVEAVAGRKVLKANSHLYDLLSINDYNAATLLVWQGNIKSS